MENMEEILKEAISKYTMGTTFKSAMGGNTEWRVKKTPYIYQREYIFMEGECIRNKNGEWAPIINQEHEFLIFN